jgi:DNA gyrase subunit A
MQLGSLTSIEREEIAAEREAVDERIEHLETVLDDPAALREVIAEELREVRDAYADERRTEIVTDPDEPTTADLIPEEECLIVLTDDDYVKRTPLDAFSPQRRGGKGVIGTDPKDGDDVATAFVANTHDDLLCFTDTGRVFRLPAYDVPEMGRTARGRAAANVLDLGEESVVAVADADAVESGYVITVTRDGYVKRTAAEAFDDVLSTGIIAARLADGDELVDVAVTDGDRDLVIGTRDGMTIRFDEDEVRPTGRATRGVHGVRLEEGDAVAGVAAVDPAVHSWLLTVTRNGYGKRTDIGAYRRQSRNGKGLVDIDTGERNGPVVTVEAVGPGDHLIATSARGQVIRTPVEEVSVVGRNTKGVVVMRLDDGDRVADVDAVPAEAMADDA